MEVTGMSSRDWGVVARYGVPGLLLGLGLAWAFGGGGLGAQAQMIPPPDRARAAAQGEASGTIAFTAPLTSAAGTSPAQLLYLIDTRSRAFAVYRIDPTSPKGAVKLEAARQYQWDLKLTEYNNQAPEPDAIEAAVKAAGQMKR